MQCHRCHGTKNCWVHPSYREDVPKERKKIFVEFPCNFCDGTGESNDNALEWMMLGDILKDRRIAKKLTLRKAAKLLRMDVVKLSGMEIGKIEPDMSITYEMMMMMMIRH